MVRNMRINRLYRVWNNMRQRCSNPNNTSYHNYGGRGIYVVPEWKDFAVFEVWCLAHGYDGILDLDRKNTDGPYSPDNCQFIPHIDNLNKKRTSVLVTAFGETKTITQWSRDPRCVVDPKTIKRRVGIGMSPESALVHKAYA